MGTSWDPPILEFLIIWFNRDGKNKSNNINKWTHHHSPQLNEKKNIWFFLRHSESLQKFLFVFICENIRYDTVEETDDFIWEKSNIRSILD